MNWKKNYRKIVVVRARQEKKGFHAADTVQNQLPYHSWEHHLTFEKNTSPLLQKSTQRFEQNLQQSWEQGTSEFQRFLSERTHHLLESGRTAGQLGRERSFSLGIIKLKDLKNHTKFGILTAPILSLQIVKWTVKSNIHFSMDPRSMRLMGEKQGKMRSCKHTCYNAWCTSTVIGDNVGITRSWIWISLIWCPFHNLNEICHKTWDKALENASIPS